MAVISSGQIVALPRRDAPGELNADEVAVWISVVNAQPSDWLSSATVPLLVQYCRHVVHARRIAELIANAMGDESFSIDDYDRLLKMQERESRAIVALATKMRLTQQSTTNHRGNKRPITAARPWDM